MALEAGNRLGPYEIIDLLGEGGMGEVYRAKDTKLGREVAIKLLLEEVSADPDRLARFDREAKVLASLNHNNIATLHGFERDGDTSFLVYGSLNGEASRCPRAPRRREAPGQNGAERDRNRALSRLLPDKAECERPLSGSTHSNVRRPLGGGALSRRDLARVGTARAGMAGELKRLVPTD